MKWIIRIVLVIVVLVLVLGAVAFVQMDRIATVGLEKAMAFATQCEVDVKKVDVSPFSGSAELSGLDIKNPADFRSIQDSFLILNTGNAGVDLGTLRSDEVEIPEVRLDGVEISLVGRDGKTNYDTILASLARLQGEDAPKQEGEEEGGKQFVIRKVSIPAGITVHLDMDADPVMGLAPLKLDLQTKPIELTDVGAGGVPLSQISADLIADILVQVVAQLGDQLGDRVLSGLTNGLSGVVGGAEELQAQISNIAADLELPEINVGKHLQGAGDLVGGILGGSDDDEKPEENEEEGGNLLDRIRGN